MSGGKGKKGQCMYSQDGGTGDSSEEAGVLEVTFPSGHCVVKN